MTLFTRMAPPFSRLCLFSIKAFEVLTVTDFRLAKFLGFCAYRTIR